MAGSYDHIMGGWSNLENMGDAKETIEELLWLVQSEIGVKRACKALNKKYYPMVRREIKPDETFNMVRALMDE